MQPIDVVASRSKDDMNWSEAYSRVENYFFSLRIKDKVLLNQWITHVLTYTANNLPTKSKISPAAFAIQEAHREVQDWFNGILSAAGMESEIGAKGRLALFLSDLPHRWQGEFLHTGPWSEAFLQDLRQSYLHTGPGLRKSLMKPRDIDLGPVSAIADDTWRVFGRWPLLGTVVVWTIYIGILGLIAYLTR